MNALKALQPSTTLPATIPHFEENRRQSFSGKEVKDNCFKGAHVTEVADECANSQDSTNPTWAGDQSRIREKDVPPHGPRKRHLGGQIFGLELIIGLHCLMTDMRGGQLKEEFGIRELQEVVNVEATP
ncbi:hypothetical protein Tco_1267944 [Tanacetum coccineum]